MTVRHRHLNDDAEDRLERTIDEIAIGFAGRRRSSAWMLAKIACVTYARSTAMRRGG
jgi:hypothetical protein